ncbi:MAG: NAD(+)/NADH kinase [Pseudomonadota bacterium]|nr:NAD(+)/NADH kinase [Pseudomonadota bacterium]
MSAKVGLCVNPMSGRDVRRLAARASNMTHEAKRDIVARVAAGANAVGATDIYIAREPFNIASKALEFMVLKARVHVVEYPITNTAKDTEAMIQRFKTAGCHTVVSLGGDGTNRAIVRASSDLDLIPISTGTNNVFPMLVEPTIAGMVAGLNARGVLDGVDVGLKQAAKVLHIETPRSKDIGLIDAVLLADDKVGNLLPFEAERLRRMVLTRAEPNAIGMSPIGGFIDPVYASDNAGLQVDMGPGGHVLHAPLSPGLFRAVPVIATARVALGQPVEFAGPGVIALDGDRDHDLASGEFAQVTVRRDGPRVFDTNATMRWAVAKGMMGPGQLRACVSD